MSKTVQDALSMLIFLIDGGSEYPDAEFLVSERFHLSPRQLKGLREAYDWGD